MLSSQEEQEDRRRTLQNDVRVREQEEQRRVFAPDQSLPRQGTTMHQFAQNDAQMPRGRFSAIETVTVVGANPTINYPGGPAWSAGPGAQCVEPPLGLDNPALEVASTVSTPQATDGAVDAPSASVPPGSMSERAGSSLSSGDPAVHPNVNVGSPVTYRRF
jgi:hypothetical protein